MFSRARLSVADPRALQRREAPHPAAVGGGGDRRTVPFGRQGRRPGAHRAALSGSEEIAGSQRSGLCELTKPRTACELSGGARWWIVGLLAAALFINYVDRGAVPAAAPLIQKELGLSAAQLGVLFSAFFWSYALLQLPVGWLAERYGAHRVLAVGLAVWACATMLVGLAHSFPALLGLRLLLGIGESAGFPCLSNLLATVMPVKSLGRANGIVACGYLFGPAVGAYCGGLIMAHYGWRAPFWVFSGLSLLWLPPGARGRLPQGAGRTSGPHGPTPGRAARQASALGPSPGTLFPHHPFLFHVNL